MYAETLKAQQKQDNAAYKEAEELKAKVAKIQGVVNRAYQKAATAKESLDKAIGLIGGSGNAEASEIIDGLIEEFSSAPVKKEQKSNASAKKEN